MIQTTPTTPTASTTPISSPFVKIPDYILSTSLSKNNLILPLYIYSAISSNPYNNNSIDTNLSLITSTFFPHASTPTFNSSAKYFKEALLYLSNSFDNPPFEFPSASSSITKTTHLHYIFLNRSLKTDSHWTKLTYQEYFYLLNSCSSANLNAPVLLNLYIYLKQKIRLSQFFISQNSSYNLQTSSVGFRASLDSISKELYLAPNTLSKYFNQLASLDLISINTIYCSNKLVNNYKLSTKWLEKYKIL